MCTKGSKSGALLGAEARVDGGPEKRCEMAGGGVNGRIPALLMTLPEGQRFKSSVSSTRIGLHFKRRQCVRYPNLYIVLPGNGELVWSQREAVLRAGRERDWGVEWRGKREMVSFMSCFETHPSFPWSVCTDFTSASIFMVFSVQPSL